MPTNLNISPIGGYPTGGASNTFTGLGRVLYVSSTYGKNSNNGSVDNPVTTIAKALSLLTTSNVAQNRGDTIVCLPGHSESINSSLPLTISRAGVTIMGLGNGALQPQLLLDTAVGSTITVSAAGVTLKNMRITANFDAVTRMVTVASTGLTIDGCRFDSGTATNASWVGVIEPSATTSNLVDGLTITNSIIIGTDTTDNAVPINLTGTTDRVEISDNYMNVAVNSTNALIGGASGKNITNCRILRNNLVRLGTSGACIINLQGTANSGMCAYNNVKCAVAAIANIVGVIDVTGMGLIQNFGTGEDDKSGILIPAADAT